jgi:hypothetical protein
VATAWFNPLLRGAKRWIPGDNHPAAADTATGDILGQTTDQVGTPGASSTGVADSINLAKLQHALMGAQVEVDDDKNEYCLSKVTMALADGKTFTGVSCTQENFTRAIDLLEGVFTGAPGGAAHPATAEDLQPIRDAQHLPYVTRGEKTEPLFKMFGVQGDSMSLTVQGLAGRMGVEYPKRLDT